MTRILIKNLILTLIINMTGFAIAVQIFHEQRNSIRRVHRANAPRVFSEMARPPREGKSWTQEEQIEQGGADERRYRTGKLGRGERWLRVGRDSDCCLKGSQLEPGSIMNDLKDRVFDKCSLPWAQLIKTIDNLF